MLCYECCYGFSNDIQPNKQQNLKVGGGFRNVFKFDNGFQEHVFRGNQIFWESVSTILQLLVASSSQLRRG